MSRCLAAALEFAGYGIPVFPCVPNEKRPLTSRGFHDASTDPEQIERWFRGTPGANLAVPTGARSELLVVDLDCKRVDADGRASLAALQLTLGALPETLVSLTPSGGEHRWLTMPAPRIRNFAPLQVAGVKYPGIDIRAEGGYVVVPPSVIDGRAYEWREGRPIADLPSAWVVALTPAERPVAEAPAWTPRDDAEQTVAYRWTVRALQNEARLLARTPAGQRNDRLWRSAAALGGLVHLGGIDAEEVRRALLWACSRWSERDERKDTQTLERALAWGIDHPRSVDLTDRRSS